MRFPTVFKRRVGERPKDEDEKKVPLLGSDKYPEGAPAKADNFHTSTLVNINGFPAQRVVVGLVGPKEALGRRVELVLLLHEDVTDGWLQVPGDVDVRVGGLAFFDAPCLLSHGKGRSDDDSHNPGSLDVCLVPRTHDGKLVLDEADGPLPDGLYSFVVGTDVSNPGR